MKKNYLPVLMTAILFGMSSISTAQNTIFSEDFETSPVTTVVNDFGGNVPDGPSPCGKASRGNTADFNSSSVDFMNAQNSSYFLGVNPESPCGGYYNANLSSNTMDWSGTDSLVFSCRYFIGTGLNWGPTNIEVIFTDGTTGDTLDSQFSTTGSWAQIETPISSSLVNNPSVTIEITMGGGEGVGIDDFEITNYEPNLTASVSSLSGFTYSEGSGPSGEQSFFVSGSTLSDDATLNAPADFEISETSGSGFGNSIVLTPTPDTIVDTEIFVRMKSGLTSSGSPYSGDVTIQSPGASMENVSLSGTVTGSTSTITENSTEDIDIFPNPFTKQLNIQLGRDYSSAQLRIIDITGQEVFTQKLNNSHEINVEINQSSGIYFVKIELADRVVTKKIVKK